MRSIVILSASVMVLAALCFSAEDKKAAPARPSAKEAPAPAANVVTQPTEKPVARSAEATKAKPITDPHERTSANQSVSERHSPDEEAIRLSGDSFAKAYASADAKLIAAHFAPDAEYIDERGNVYQGRAAIEEVMTGCFAEHAGCRIEFDIESIRVISAGVAIVDGNTTVSHSHGTEPIPSRYSAVHVKADGKWLIASIREHAPTERRQHRSQLEQLGWLKGEWVDEGEDALVVFSCASTDNGNFLLRTFTIQIDGQEAMNGSQRIGWDPLSGKLRAWIFDSEGGYCDGVWHRDGNRWLLKSIGVTADGQSASGTSIYTFIDENTMTWQLVDHEVAGVQVPDSDLVTIVRRAPSPEMADETPLTKSK